MKKIMALMTCCCAYFCALSMTNAIGNNDNISFYQTNLICGAASDIGCGTKAKPILLDFMEHDAVSEASLNHAGTVIAVVWNQGIENKSEIANHIFAENSQPFVELTGESRDEQVLDYRKGKWYKGREVDALSVIEAGRIADQMIAWVDEESGISEEIKARLHEAFEQYIKKSLLANEDKATLNKTSYWRQWEKDLTDIGRKLIGDDMPKVQIVPSSAGEECTPEKSCCKDEGSSACCKKRN